MSLQKGLIGHWTMDDRDASNGTLYDSSAYDNHATINGPTSTTGFWDGAYDFTQSNSDHMITSNSTVSGDPPATLSVWAKASTTNQTDFTGIIGLGTNQSTNTTFCINTEGNGNNIAVHTWENSTPQIALDDTNWHHYAGINTGSGTQKFYFDGEFVGSMDNTLSIPAEPSVIGARKYAVEDDNNRFWDGKIQDARIYNRALSESEISALYNMRSQRQQNVKPYQLRPKPGEPQNFMDATQWTVGTDGSQGDFNRNGATNESSIIEEATPYGDLAPLWYGRSEDTGSNPDGGWNWYGLDASDINRDKTYRYSVWMKQEYTSGRVYHGTENVETSGGNFDSNPYYFAGDLPEMDKWYLLVGYNHSQNANKSLGMSAMYDTNGNKVQSLSDFWWEDGDTDFGSNTMRWRSYYYYDSNVGRGARFYDPRLEILDDDYTRLSEMFNACNDFSDGRSRIHFDGFESTNLGPSWDVTTGNITSNRQYSGDYSFGSWTDGNNFEATWTPFDGERQISEFEYYWKEDSSQTGHVVILNDSNGNEVQESGTENPQWYLNDGSGGREQIHGSGGTNYNVWTRFYFDFDWTNGEYDYVLEKSNDTATRTGTQPLDNSTGVSEIRFTGSGYGTADFCRFDDVTIYE